MGYIPLFVQGCAYSPAGTVSGTFHLDREAGTDFKIMCLQISTYMPLRGICFDLLILKRKKRTLIRILIHLH